jgi:hypothetical protein
MVEAHPGHASALPWLQRAKEKADAGLVAAGSIAELYEADFHRLAPDLAERITSP